MGFLSKLLGRDKPAPTSAAAEHAVLIHLKLGDDQFGLEGEVAECHALQDELEKAIKRAGAGELDGDEFGGGECVVYTYGADADKLWESMAPVLEGKPFREGSYAVKRYGEPGAAREERIDLPGPG